MNDRQGFTLLEMLIAMIIVGLVISIFFQLLSSSINLERKARGKTHAMLTAHTIVEKLKYSDPRKDGFKWQGSKNGYTWNLRLQPISNIIFENMNEELAHRVGQTSHKVYNYSLEILKDNKPVLDLNNVREHTSNFFTIDFLNSIDEHIILGEHGNQTSRLQTRQQSDLTF